MIRHLFIGSFLFITFWLQAQEQGDFRSIQTGNWNDFSTWEIHNGGNWVAAQSGQTPGNQSSVWIQIHHQVSLTAHESVKSIHINCGETSGGAGGGTLNLSAFNLNVYGYVRTYFGALGNTPPLGTNDFGGAGTGAGASQLSTSSGKLRFVGSSRVIIHSGAFNLNIGHQTNVEVDAPGQELSLNDGFRVRNLEITAGTLNCNAFRLSQGPQGVGPIEGEIRIKAGAVLRSAASGSSSGNAVIARNNSDGFSKRLVLEEGSFLILEGAEPHIWLEEFINNGTVVYQRSSSQSALKKNANCTSCVSPTTYSSLQLDGPTNFNLSKNLSVGDSLIISKPVSFSSPDFSFHYSPYAWLVFKGNADYTLQGSEWHENNPPSKLMVNFTGNLNLNESKTLTSMLSLKSGKIISTDNISLILGPNSQVDGGNQNSFIDGKVIQIGVGEKRFPIGSGTYYRPVISNFNQSGTYTIWIERTELSGEPVEPILEVNKQFHWRFSTLEGSLGQGILTFSYHLADINSQEEDIRIVFSPTSEGNLSMLPLDDGPANGQISVQVNPDGYYGLGTISPSSVLPVVWDYFKANPKINGGIELAWGTKSEKNTSHFELERSINSDRFQTIAKIQSAGESDIPLRYTFTDFVKQTGNIYYRIKQVDMDTKYSYSDLIRVKVKATTKPLLWVDKGSLWLIPADEDTYHSIKLFTLDGKLIFSKIIESNIQLQPIHLELPLIARGIYLVHYQNKVQNYQTRVLVK